jgi:hypothetical protein
MDNSAKSNSSSEKVVIQPRKNFMQNASDQEGVLKKREEFAVNLRRQKT